MSQVSIDLAAEGPAPIVTMQDEEKARLQARILALEEQHERTQRELESARQKLSVRNQTRRGACEPTDESTGEYARRV